MLLDLGARPQQLAHAYLQVRAVLLLFTSKCTHINCRSKKINIYLFVSVYFRDVRAWQPNSASL